MQAARRVVLRECRSAEGEIARLEAYLDEHGDLIFEGYDLGSHVRAVWGDSDDEYWRRVRSECVPIVLLELIRERFDSDVDFHEWLSSKGIPDEFGSWA